MNRTKSPRGAATWLESVYWLEVSSRHPIKVPYLIKVRQPHTIRVLDARSKATLRVITSTGRIRKAWCSATRRGEGRRFVGIWVIFDDNRTEIYSAKTGRLLSEIADQRNKNPALTAKLLAVIKRSESPVRYAVVCATEKNENGFYDSSIGGFEWNRVPDTALFKDREVAEAVASVLTEQFHGKRDFPGKLRPFQTIALRKTPKGRTFLGKIRGDHESYIPTLSVRASPRSVHFGKCR